MINTRLHTAFHIVVVVAINEGRGVQTTSQALADIVKTNASYIRTMMSPLVKHGILKSSMGFGGGITLGRAPTEISLKDIYKAIFAEQSIWISRAGSGSDTVSPVFLAIQAKAEAAMLNALAAENVSSIVQELTTVH